MIYEFSIRMVKKHFTPFISSIAIILLTGFWVNKPTYDSSYDLKASTPEVPFDTLAVLEKLSFTKYDSLYLYLNQTGENPMDFHDEVITSDTISAGKRPVYFHVIISYHQSKVFNEWHGAFAILYTQDYRHSQTNRIVGDSIELSLGGTDSFEPGFLITDINYDGYKDIVVSLVENSTGRNSYNFFFTYDSQTNQFTANHDLDSLFHNLSIYINEDIKEISTGGNTGAQSYYGEDYRWNGHQYKLFAIDKTDYNDDASLIISTRKELINGVWVIVNSDTTEAP